MFCTSYFNSSSTSIRTFLLKVFHFNDYQMSFVADSPVNSSSSDDFAAFLDAQLGGNSAESSPDEEAEDDDFKDEEAGDEEPEDEEARDEEAEDEEAGDDNDLNNKRIKRCKVEVLESIHKQGSTSYATLEQQTGVEGGFDSNEAEYDDTHNIVILPDYVTLPFPSVELPEKVRLAVDAILMAEGAERKDQLQHGQLIRSKPVHMQ
ncbi:hypothetical protein Patl1_07311 [Pistacia atlantica]|uniref:Uncharacterized protein n=1 Tax=Pistacia atlantica TaxID=434234 RepID=A0ACC1AL43_9ROSI|nr:hypothetical protein Patl1_07311 [Pistacia atlantica]